LAFGEEDVEQGDDVWVPPQLPQKPHLAQQPQRRHPVRQCAFNFLDGHPFPGDTALCRDDIAKCPLADDASSYILVSDVEILLAGSLKSELCRQSRIRRGIDRHTVFSTNVYVRCHGVGLRA
jgi:hypothetical protein